MKAKTQPRRRRITFAFEGTEGTDVFVAGTFNDWSETRNKLAYKDGYYSRAILLPPGRYEYKFIVNGEWHVDPSHDEWTINEHGSLNSVLIVK